MTIAKGSEGSVSAQKEKKKHGTQTHVRQTQQYITGGGKKLGPRSVLPCIAFVSACWLLSLHTCHSEIQPLECFRVIWRASYGIVSMGEVSGDKALWGGLSSPQHFSLLSTPRLIGKKTTGFENPRFNQYLAPSGCGLLASFCFYLFKTSC